MSDQFYCEFLAIFGGFLGFLSFALPNWPPFPQINVLKYTSNIFFFFWSIPVQKKVSKVLKTCILFILHFGRQANGQTTAPTPLSTVLKSN